MKIKGMVAAAIMAAGWVFPAAAQDTTHGCACFHNNTTGTIAYRYKWGDGQWQPHKLPPNNQSWICWKYDSGQKNSPNLTFQLDVDMTKGSAWTTYSITRVQAKAAHCSAVPPNGHYDISYRPNTNNAFIQVTRRN